MAKTTQVWGIDFGQCALKALRCHKEGDQVVATAFDYIEYPKILTQPEADAPALMKEALTQFLDRNDLRGCKVMISVPGQAGLSRFFKPPPVEAKRIPDIVRFEARQQIPFPLDEVIWDYQRMSGGAELDGVALDAEVGLFAMKREQVFKYIKPFVDAEVELDVVQLAPLAIYNFVSTELLKPQDPEEYDSDDPPESLVVLSMGTDSTDLVVTNGFRVWQRSIPLGGNHFTRHLTKDLKLTFAKAEHLKRNVRDAEDPKRVFQAMRPAFNDLVTEVQRSIGFFQGIDRKAKISGVVVAGNTVKLPGLQQYLAKNLGYDVVDFTGFQKLQGGEVLASPEFKDNVLSFCVSYGLCLQGLGVGKLQTNLVPRELLTERMVRAKKPWAVAALSALLLGFSFQYFLQQSAWYQVNEKRTVAGVSWDQASQRVESLKSRSSKLKSTDTDLKTELTLLTEIGREVAGNADRRLLWLELCKAINNGLPVTKGLQPGDIPDLEEIPYEKRRELFITDMETQYFPDLKEWFTDAIKVRYILDVRAIAEARLIDEQAPDNAGAVAPSEAKSGAGGTPAEVGPADGGASPAAPANPGTPASGAPAPGDLASQDPASGDATAPAAEGDAASEDATAAAAADAAAADPTVNQEAAELTPPEGAGWVVQLKGFHVHNEQGTATAMEYVRATLLNYLENGEVDLPIGKNPGDPEGPPLTATFTMKELGIQYAVIINGTKIMDGVLPNPKYIGSTSLAGMGGGGGEGGEENDGDMGPAIGSMGGGGAGMSLGALPGAGASGGGLGSSPGRGSLGSGPNMGGQTDEETEPPTVPVKRVDFTIQFCWQPQPLSERLEQRRKKEEERQEAANAGGDVAANLTGNGGT